MVIEGFRKAPETKDSKQFGTSEAVGEMSPGLDAKMEIPDKLNGIELNGEPAWSLF